MDYYITKYDTDPPEGAGRAVLEDSIMQKGYPVTAGSKILENFISPLDATVVTRLETAGVCILGKTKMEEFGIYGLFEARDGSLPRCPNETEGGSLSRSPDKIAAMTEDDTPSNSLSRFCGAVAAVADGEADFALCNDYTGAVSREAAARGVCYLHPTYGTVSRFGLIPAVPSMDQIGVVCKTPAEGFRVLSIISGYDEKDGAIFTPAARQSALPHEGAIRLGIPANVMALALESEILEGLPENLETVVFELKYFDVYTQVMQILCSAELSGNISRYDGVKFGYRAKDFSGIRELYTRSRTEAFGQDAKVAALLGAMVLSKENYSGYYDKAMRIRRLIKESLEFDKYDVIILPVCLNPSPTLPQGSPAMNGDYAYQHPDWQCNNGFEAAAHALPMLCGLPAITLPYRGGGVTLVADAGCESILRTALKAVGA